MKIRENCQCALSPLQFATKEKGLANMNVEVVGENKGILMQIL